MFQRFTATVIADTEDQFRTLRPGQWFRTSSGARGQFLGITAAGVIVNRWQSGRFASTASGGTTPQDDARNNRPPCVSTPSDTGPNDASRR
jgi:hypothetical protein